MSQTPAKHPCDMRDELDASISRIATGDGSSVSFDGTSYSELDIDKLVKLRDYYHQQCIGLTTGARRERPGFGHPIFGRAR